MHTLVERRGYTGPFLPGFGEPIFADPLSEITESPGLLVIDHVVGNQPEGDMEPTAVWYERMLDFHRFWSVDETQIHTEYSALRSVVVTDWEERVKMPINEPAPGKKKSQIQEYVEFYGGPGVQHVALRTDNIIEAVGLMQERGLRFLTIPDTYYDALREKLQYSPVEVRCLCLCLCGMVGWRDGVSLFCFMFVFLFVCLFVCFFRLFVCLFCLFVCLFVCLIACFSSTSTSPPPPPVSPFSFLSPSFLLLVFDRVTCPRPVWVARVPPCQQPLLALNPYSAFPSGFPSAPPAPSSRSRRTSTGCRSSRS